MEHPKIIKELQPEAIEKLHQQQWLKYIQHIPLSRSFTVIYLAGKGLDKRKIAQMTYLNMEKMDEVLLCRKHILNLHKYVPGSQKYLTPNKLKSVIVVVEILNELMFRLSRVGAKMTDDEWLINARMLKTYFNVKHMQINENWVKFFRANFNHMLQFEKCDQIRNKIKFDLRSILRSIEYMFDPMVVASFESYLGYKKVIFKCKDLYGFVNDVSLDKSITACKNHNRSLEPKTESIINQELAINEDFVESKTDNSDQFNENDCYEIIEIDEINLKEEICEVGNNEVNIDLIDEAVTLAEPMRTVTTNETLKINKTRDPKNCPTKVSQRQTKREKKINLVMDVVANNEESNDIIEIFDDVDVKEEEKDKLKNQPVKTVKDEDKCCQFIEADDVNIKKVIVERVAGVERWSTERPVLKLLAKKANEDEQRDMKRQSYIKQECINTEELHIIDVIKEEACDSEYNDNINESNEDPTMPVISIASMKESVEKNTIRNTYGSPDYDKNLANTKIAEIARIFIHDSTPLEIDFLKLDPIISYYMQLSRNTIKPTGTLPKFNEKLLRLSFATVLGKRLQNWTQPICVRPEDIDLYRTLVMLTYSLEYNSPTDLRTIMDPFCLQIHTMLSYFQETLEEWRIFFNQQFISPLFKIAVYDMLYEYSRRSLIINGTVNEQAFLQKSKEIQLFLGCKLSLKKNWQREYSEYMKYINKSKKYFKYRKFTNKDLHLLSIYNDIKDDLDEIIVLGVKHTHSISTESLEPTLKAVVHSSVGKLKSSTIKKPINSNNIQVKFSDNCKQKNSILSDSPNHHPYAKIRNETTAEPLNKKHKMPNHQNESQLQDLAETAIHNKTNKLPTDPISELQDQFSNKHLRMNANETNNSRMQVKPTANHKQQNTMTTSRSEKLKRKIQSEITVESINEKLEINSNHQNKCQLSELSELTNIQIQSEVKDLLYDPIIALYLKNSKQKETALPAFSEKRLRQAFDEVVNENQFGLNVNMCKQEELVLYRKLILLYYFQYYEELDQLYKIMQCFSKKYIYECLNDYKNIIQQWQIFLNENLSHFLYKEALYELLFEYANRYLRIFKSLPDELLKRKALEIQKLLGCSLQLPDYWVQEFTALLKNRLWKKIEKNGKLHRSYLDLISIFEIAKQRFPRFLQHIVIRVAEEKTKPPTKRLRSAKITNTDNLADVEQLQQPNYIASSDMKKPDVNIENSERDAMMVGKEPGQTFSTTEYCCTQADKQDFRASVMVYDDN